MVAKWLTGLAFLLVPAVSTAAVPDNDPPVVEESNRRTKTRRRRQPKYKLRYRNKEKHLAVVAHMGIAQPFGSVAHAFKPGPTVGAQFRFGFGDGNFVAADIQWSYHRLHNPRAMFFRSAFLEGTRADGSMQILSPALLYGYSAPATFQTRGRARLNPTLFFGIAPDFSFVTAQVDHAGRRGTVTGTGSQLFAAFVSGLQLDIRFADHWFIGIESRLHVTIPVARPPVGEELVIPRLYFFTGAVTMSHRF